ncbi:MAG TPA: efflux RND transporter periplasmic adaptor subunit [Usitatibacter sp.]|nr:efflux RND transporter periplasmic adaptor subunit [Usitatibacter sp.]
MNDTTITDTTTTSDPLTREALTGTPARRRRGPWIAGAIAAVLALAGGYAMLQSQDDARAPRYRTELAVRAELVVTVSATGSLQPTNKVDVGSELSGQIEKVLVDDNDPVKKGQVLAQLDLSKLTDQVERSRSALASAQAKVNQAGATLAEARATLERLRQVRELSGGKVPSQAELTAAEAAVTRAIAEEASAKASVTEATAALRSDETNVRKASIRSPIDGVVLARKVEPGQTVAASLQAPVLFQLAEDLKQMELQVDVDEADVGRVRDGQPATFTVDAYPGRRYPAKVLRVGYGSQVKDNVVTYPTLLSANNDDLSLRPGMTATAEITAARRADALLVPNAALRFTPPSSGADAKAPSGGLVSKLMPRPPRPTVRRASNASRGAEQNVWVLQDGQPVQVAVTVGLTDGTRTEVTGGAIAADAPVIVEAVQAEAK